jgi:xanthine dehydrogenase accessory factor
MSTLRDQAARWLAASRPAIVVEVGAVRGSVPRETGTRMLVSEARCAGTVGGGHLEWKAIEAARAMLAAGEARPRSLHFPLGPALGQCCGGTVDLSLAPLDAAALAAWPRSAPRFWLQLYGAGHVGRAIVRALMPLPVEVEWIDEREDEFPASLAHDALDSPATFAERAELIGDAATRSRDAATGWPAHIRKVCVDSIESEVRNAPPGACYLVLTHQHDLDLRITEAILKRGDFCFLGLIGSKTKKQRFIHRFEQRGIAPETIARMTCPIGIAGIEGKEPEVIAAAVVAQLLQVSSATGGSHGALPRNTTDSLAGALR